MRKNELIKLLQEIPGNPNVVIWNGFVGDYHHPEKPQLLEFSRMTKKFFSQLLNAERRDKGLPPITESEYKALPQQEWQLGSIEWDSDKTNMIVIEMKCRNKETFDRLSTIRY